MHIPDGFVDAQVCLGAGLVAAVGVGVCLKGARRTLDQATAPLAGLVAVFVFAGQMLNFPVGAGTSGHLLAGALAAILIGPYAGVLAVTVVLVVQALLFADGGLTALGLNIVNLALVTVLVSWATFRLAIRLAPRGRSGILAASFLAGLLSVAAAAASFVAEFALGGTAPVSLAALGTAVIGVHVVIGTVEGVITALVIGAVASVRPDLVAGLRRLPTRSSVSPARTGASA